jgi:hypothetical protein
MAKKLGPSTQQKVKQIKLIITFTFTSKHIFGKFTLAVWHCAEGPGFESQESGHKVFRSLYIAVLLSNPNMHRHYVYLRKINVKFF